MATQRPQATPQPPRTFAETLAPGIGALKANWPAMLFIQIAATTIVVAYYTTAQVRAQAARLVEFQAEAGMLFPLVVGVFAGAILPETARAMTGLNRRFDREWFGNAAFTGAVYSVLAVVVDRFYILQADWFGARADAATLAVKTAIDMGIAAPLLFVPFTVGAFHWRHSGYRVASLGEILTPPGYYRLVVPTLLPNWAFWIPVLLSVYAMPTALQYPLSVFATACWSLLFVFINRKVDS